MKRARHLAMARHLDAEQPCDVDVGRDLQQRVIATLHRSRGRRGTRYRRVRYAGLARLSATPLLTVELADGATVDELFARLSDTQPEIAPALRSALPVVAGEHVPR